MPRVRKIGINDANYQLCKYKTVSQEGGKCRRVLAWKCPFYQVWESMLRRVYDEKYHKRFPTYVGCSVADEWLLFSNFKAWMEKQDWEDNQLDKDLLIQGNKLYSAETCVFIDRKVNIFITEVRSNHGEWPVGVRWDTKANKFQARCRNPFTGYQEYLGLFTTPEDAHTAWLDRKRSLALTLAELQGDARISKALVERY